MSPSLLAAINFVAFLVASSFLAGTIARARWRTKGNAAVVLWIVLCGQVWLVPQAINFVAFHSLRLLYPLWFGNWIVTAAAAIIFPLVFRNRARDLFDAARLDGTGVFGIFRHVIWPTAQAALFSLGVLLLMTTWTEFAHPLFAATGKVPMTAFADCTAPTAPRDLAILLGASVFAALPITLLYLFARKAFLGAAKSD